MEKMFTSKTYENYERIGEPFKKNNKYYTKVRCKCDRCTNGIYAVGVENGHIKPHPAYNGICLKCGGSGFLEKEVRLYTEKEKEQLIKAEQKRIEKRELEDKKKIEKLQKESEENKKEWLLKNGFNEEGLTWCVFGDDTYSIKESLKELGCKFSPILKWHCDKPLDLPEGYGMSSFAFDDLYEWNPQVKNAFFYENAKEKVDKAFKQAEGPSLSEYVGEVGERLRNITAIYKSSRGFDSRFGWTNIHTFEVGNDGLVWFTQKDLNFEKGEVVELTGTIKKHEEFRGVKTTQLSRCIIKKIGV